MSHDVSHRPAAPRGRAGARRPARRLIEGSRHTVGPSRRTRQVRLPIARSPHLSATSRAESLLAALAQVIRDAIEFDRVNTIGAAASGAGATIPPPDTDMTTDGERFDPTAA